MEVIEHCDQFIQEGNQLSSDFIIEQYMKGRGKPSGIQYLQLGLENSLYYYNTDMTRFVLSKLDELSHSREYRPDLWARNEKGVLVWTVEHVLPQGGNVPPYWVDMIADGDREKAKDIHGSWVHCLGNLTLSGYNSQLSNASFEDKQNLHENRKFLGHNINIGYKNGLALNNLSFSMNDEETCLSKIDKWTENSIKERNVVMIDALLKVFAFNVQELMDLERE